MDRGGHKIANKNYPDRVKIPARSPPQPIPTTVKFSIDPPSPPRRVQPALPTGTQGEEGYTYGNGVPPPIVGRLGTSGESGSHQQFCDHRSTTMVRVSGSSGDSGFHRESLGEDVSIKIEHGIEALKAEGSPHKREFGRSPDHQSFGRDFDDKKIKEEDRAIDLEESPQFPPEVPLGTIAYHVAKRDLLDVDPSVKTDRFSSSKIHKKEKKKQ